MKKIMSIVLNLGLTATLLCNSAFAANLDFSYDKETREVELNGDLGVSEHQAALVYIFDSSISASSLNDSNPPAFADIYVTGKDGSFDYSKVISDSYPSGKYRIMVSSSEDSWTDTFMYTNMSSVTSLLPQINGVASSSALDNILFTNAGILGIDASVYTPVRTDISAFIYGIKPVGGFANAPQFVNALDQCTAAALIKSGESPSTVLKQNAKALSIDFKNDYDNFTSDIKSAINSELAGADYTSKLLSEQYKDLRAVAFIKQAPTWQSLKNAFYGVDSLGNTIVSNYTVINPDLSVFNKVVNKDEVFAEMFKIKSTLTSVPKIRTAFNTCSQLVYNSENGINSSGGSSGGGGGSPVGGPVTIEPGYQQQSQQPSKSQLFIDVPSDSWYYSYLEKMVVNKLINGYPDNSFKPETNITRAEFTKLIISLADYLKLPLEAKNIQTDFIDVPGDMWCYDVIKKASESGLVLGNDGKFSPEDQITRQDASVILYRLTSLLKQTHGTASFSDDAQIADYAKQAVNALAEAGIISGMPDGSFAPTENLTRAQAAKLLCLTLEFLS